MKGILLCGGSGTRLHPLTKVTNKHLLPVYDRPMVYYPLQTLVQAGIEEIMLVTGGNHAGEFLRLLGTGAEFGLKKPLSYAYQEEALGIAHALSLAEDFASESPVCVILGDNILGSSIADAVTEFTADPRGAMVFLKEVDNPSEYGIATLKDGEITEIVEKPKKPKSNLAVIGAYLYEPAVFEVVKTLEPSARGELEITDVSNHYLRQGKLKYKLYEGYWGDAGESIDTLLAVSNEVAGWGKEK